MSEKINKVVGELDWETYKDFLFIKGILAAPNNSAVVEALVKIAKPIVAKRIKNKA